MPGRRPTRVLHERTGWPSISTVQAPHRPSPQPYFAAGQAEVVAQDAEQRALGVGVDGPRRAVDVQFLDSRHEAFPPM